MFSRNRLGALVATFLDTQRVPPGSRLSAWMHGDSIVVRNDRAQESMHTAEREEKALERGSHRMTRQRSVDMHQRYLPSDIAVGTRVNFSRPILAESHSDEASPTRPSLASPLGSRPHQPGPQSPMRAQPRAGVFQRRGMLFAHSKDPRIQCKSIGTFVSGTVLIVVLTVYLALATANVVPTLAFHATFIFCIIVATIVFAHFLIRLCMLTVRAQPETFRTREKPRKTRRRRRRRHCPPSDIESGLDNSTALPEHADGNNNSHGVSVDDSDSNLVAPPPAYGWWRGSIRVNPEDVRQCSNEDVLHQQTRNLVFAGSGQRPPSYTSEAIEDVECPAPLFNARRIPLRDQAVRDV